MKPLVVFCLNHSLKPAEEQDQRGLHQKIRYLQDWFSFLSLSGCFCGEQFQGFLSYPSVFCLRLRTKRVKGIPQISSSLISYRNTIVLTFNSLCSWKIRHVDSMQVLVFILFVRNWWGVFAPNCLVRPLPLTSFPLHELISLFLFLLSLRHVLISLGFAVVNTEVSGWMATGILFRFFLRLLFDWTLQSWSSWISTVDEAWFFT